MKDINEINRLEDIELKQMTNSTIMLLCIIAVYCLRNNNMLLDLALAYALYILIRLINFIVIHFLEISFL